MRSHTALVHDVVPWAELMVVQVLDGDEVIGTDARLQPAVLPHDVRRGHRGDDLHRHPARSNSKEERGGGQRGPLPKPHSILYRG